MHKPSEEKIEQWCEFIVDHLYANDPIAYGDVKKEKKLTTSIGATMQKEECKKMLSNLDSNGECDPAYLIDAKEIKNFNDLASRRQQGSTPLLGEDPEKSNKFKKMTNRQYLQWRLKVIKDGHGQHMPEESISLKATIGLAFLSLIGMYWFFAPKTKPSIKILMGILNLFVVAALVCAIVLNLSLYFLISAAIVYGLFVLAGCIHVGLKRYSENVEYQEEFSNTYNELMEFLIQKNRLKIGSQKSTILKNKQKKI